MCKLAPTEGWIIVNECPLLSLFGRNRGLAGLARASVFCVFGQLSFRPALGLTLLLFLPLHFLLALLKGNSAHAASFGALATPYQRGSRGCRAASP